LSPHVHCEAGVPVGGCGSGEVGKGAESGVTLGVCQVLVEDDGLCDTMLPGVVCVRQKSWGTEGG
jgi:hypothetical protein